jgi:hypothetical protein
MYEIMKNDCQRGKVNWVSKVKSLLENNGFFICMEQSWYY